MSNLSEIIPTEIPRIMDLVKKTGMDVGDWGDFKGGQNRAASNPKYCYEWSFVPPSDFVILNIWYENITESADGSLCIQINMRDLARTAKKGIWRKRAGKMDRAIQLAWFEGRYVRAIICSGCNRDGGTSHVQFRKLDDAPWTITDYLPSEGSCTLIRGLQPKAFRDDTTAPVNPMRKTAIANVFIRDPEVHNRVIARAKGFCEWCNEKGFLKPNRDRFLETHHVLPLSEGGLDTENNVVALCPNHHREAHYGERSAEMFTKLIQVAKEKSNNRTSGNRKWRS